MHLERDYRDMPICECGEPLVALLPSLSRIDPHPYASLGAPYGDASPFMLRSGVLVRLLAAQQQLERERPDLRLQIFDAYRPVAVQQFMVEWTFGQLAREAGLVQSSLTAEQRAQLYAKVHQFWAVPSLDPSRPPPHSTGAAVDLTLVTVGGDAIEMGGAIDEISGRSYPEHYAHSETTGERAYHEHRALLRGAMESAGFNQHLREWWHFSFGDQMWALYQGQATARYGRAM